MTEDAADGRPWPVDPPVPQGTSAPTPVPELVVADGVSELLASFAGNGNGNGHRPVAPPATSPVTDEDRTTFGLLLDRAAERGLLSQSEYQLRLGELAEATSRDEMRRIVTELPAFVTPAPMARSRRGRKPAFPAAGQSAVVAERRATPWALLAVVVAVLLITLVFFAFYAEHVVHQHTNGAGVPPVVSVVSGLRL